jgi:hypothetical protein
VLDSYNNPTYANGQAGSIYKQAMPLVNASCAGPVAAGLRHHLEGTALLAGRRPVSPARITVLHNGVLVQDDTVLAGRTEYIGAPSYAPMRAPLYLQEHDQGQLPQHLGARAGGTRPAWSPAAYFAR